MIKLYGTHCPQCKVIEKKLKFLGLDYEMIDDPEKVIAFGKENNINSMPIMVSNGRVMGFKEANEYIKTLAN